jgi:hypothetical protein
VVSHLNEEDDMRTLTRVGGVGVAALACGLLLVGARAGDDDAKTKAAVLKIVDALEKGDKAAAKDQAKALAKAVEDVEEIMALFGPRKKDKAGVGVGTKAGALQPDDIEKMVVALSEKGVEGVKAEGHLKALQRMGYVVAGVMEVVRLKEPEQDMGKKTKKLWRDSAAGAHKAALELAQAAQAKDAAAVQKAAARLDRACNDCHTEFKQ